MGCGEFLLGLLLGPIGCVLAVIARGAAKICPHCAERVMPNAMRCRYCHADLSLVPRGTTTDVDPYRILRVLFLFGVIPIAAVWAIVLIQEPRQYAAAQGAAPREQVPPKSSTPAPGATPPFAERLAASRKAAVTKYPDLAKAGTPFNKMFLHEYDRQRLAAGTLLTKAGWPIWLADRCAERLANPNLPAIPLDPGQASYADAPVPPPAETPFADLFSGETDPASQLPELLPDAGRPGAVQHRRRVWVRGYTKKDGTQVDGHYRDQ